MKPELLSTLTCPSCGSGTSERMPEDRCIIVFRCPRCGHLLRPRAGDCCVFCSYGTVKCPSEQERNEAKPGTGVGGTQ